MAFRVSKPVRNACKKAHSGEALKTHLAERALGLLAVESRADVFALPFLPASPASPPSSLGPFAQSCRPSAL